MVIRLRKFNCSLNYLRCTCEKPLAECLYIIINSQNKCSDTLCQNKRTRKENEISRCYLHDSMKQLETIKEKVVKLIDPVQPLQKK